jgi:hypothetical protein
MEEELDDKFMLTYRSILMSVKELDKTGYEKLTISGKRQYDNLNDWLENNAMRYFELMKI